MLGIAGDRGAELCFGPVQIALQTEREPEVVRARGVLGGELRRLPQLLDRFIQALPLRQQLAQRDA